MILFASFSKEQFTALIGLASSEQNYWIRFSWQVNDLVSIHRKKRLFFPVFQEHCLKANPNDLFIFLGSR